MASLTVYQYTRETLAGLTRSHTPDTVHHHEHRGQLKIDDLGSVTAWLARHGKPEVRAEIARGILPAVLGVTNRRSDEANQALTKLIDGKEVLTRIFAAETELLDSAKSKITKTKRRKARAVNEQRG